MKFTILASMMVASASAFHVAPHARASYRYRLSSLKSTVDSSSGPSVDVSISLAKTDLMETARSLKEEYGVLLIDYTAQEMLKEAVEKLESVSEPPVDTDDMVGDWTLLCSTASASLAAGGMGGGDDNNSLAKTIAGIDTSKLPFFNEGPLKEIRDTINKSLKVQQIIKTENSDGIDRIDHVLQYMPPDKLSAFLNNIPDAIKSLNINPLQVSQSKVTLVHKAEVESVIPVIKTKLSLSSIVVNVAGKSQILDPDGADVLGINVPFGEFLNAGSFETTYMDDKIRISRSKVGIVDQLRVFLRSDFDAPAVKVEAPEEELTTTTVTIVDEDDEVIIDLEVDNNNNNKGSVEEDAGDDISPSDV